MEKIKYQIVHRKLVKAMQAAAWEYIDDPDADEKTKVELQDALQMGKENNAKRNKKCVIAVTVIVIILILFGAYRRTLL